MGPCQILVVDDDDDIREVLSTILEESGHGVVTAKNGREALETLRQLHDKPHIILLDLMMPVMDGWGFLATQKADKALASIPVVVLTAFPRVDARDEQLAQTWLQKPVNLTTLLDIIENACPPDVSNVEGSPGYSSDA